MWGYPFASGACLVRPSSLPLRRFQRVDGQMKQSLPSFYLLLLVFRKQRSRRHFSDICNRPGFRGWGGWCKLEASIKRWFVGSDQNFGGDRPRYGLEMYHPGLLAIQERLALRVSMSIAPSWGGSLSIVWLQGCLLTRNDKVAHFQFKLFTMLARMAAERAAVAVGKLAWQSGSDIERTPHFWEMH